MLKELLFRFFLHLALKRGRWVMIVALVATIFSISISFSYLEIKTNFKYTLDQEKVEKVKTANQLSQNFPAASIIWVVFEGLERDRMVEMARVLKARLEERKDLVKAVYLELDLNFFKKNGLYYFTPEQLARLYRLLEDRTRTISGVMGDPSLRGILKQISGMVEEGVAGNRAALAIRQRFTGNLILEDQWPPQIKEFRVQTHLEPGELGRELSERLFPLLEKNPLPPSEKDFVNWLEPVLAGTELAGRILTEGKALSHGRVDEMLADIEKNQYGELGEAPEVYRFSKDGDLLLMEVAGVADIYDLKYARPFIKAIRKELSSVNDRFPDVKAGLTGFPVIFSDEEEAVMDNFAVVLILSLLGVAMIFILGFGKGGLPSLSMIPLLMGISWTFGVQTLFIGELNMISLMFPVLLAGIGIDFAIHIVSGFAENRSSGLHPEEALERTFDTMGGGILTGALTTAAAFFAMMAADYKGIRSLGFISGIGIINALISMFVVLPVLILWYDRRRSDQSKSVPYVEFEILRRIGDFSIRYRYIVFILFLGITILASAGARKIDLDRDALQIGPKDLPVHQLHKKVLDGFGLSTEYSIFQATDIEDARRIRDALAVRDTVGKILSITDLIPSRQNEARPWVEKIDAGLDRVVEDLPVEVGTIIHHIVQAIKSVEKSANGTPEEKKDAFDAVIDQVKARSVAPLSQVTIELIRTLIEDPGSMNGVHMDQMMDRIRDMVPEPVPSSYDEEEIKEMRRAMARIKLFALELSVMGKTFYGERSRKLLGRLRDSINVIDNSLAQAHRSELRLLDAEIRWVLLKFFLQSRLMASKRGISVEDLPRDIVDRFQGRDGSYMVVAYPSSYAWEETFLRRHSEDLETVGGYYSGIVPVWQHMLNKILRNVPTALATAVALVTLILFLDLLSLKGVVVVLAPLVVAMTWSLGILSLLGIKLNIVSIMALPLIIGTGIDYGVHIFHRIVYEGRDRISEALMSTGKAILMTTLTTMLGFGSLMASVHRGFFSLGFLLTLGVFLCFLASTVLLPPLIEIFWFGIPSVRDVVRIRRENSRPDEELTSSD